MTFKVMKKRCHECLYGPNKIVSNARRAQIIRDTRKKDVNFLCHKGTIRGEEIVCAGDWEVHCGQMGRIAGRLGAIEMVEPEAGR